MSHLYSFTFWVIAEQKDNEFGRLVLLFLSLTWRK